MRLIIDRIEGEYAVCEQENGEMVNVKIKLLPEGIKEGMVLIEEDQVYKIDENETKQQKERIENLIETLWE